MARITITDNQGVVVKIIEDDDIGNLTKSMARIALTEEIADAVNLARTQDQDTQVKIRYAGKVVATQTFKFLTDAQQWADEQRKVYGVGATEEISFRRH